MRLHVERALGAQQRVALCLRDLHQLVALPGAVRAVADQVGGAVAFGDPIDLLAPSGLLLVEGLFLDEAADHVAFVELVICHVLTALRRLLS